jgi:uncharacterized protein
MNAHTEPLEVKAAIRQPDLPAGCFSSWLRRMRNALVKENGIDVRCGGCTACCESSYFIHVGPDETHTLARIKRGLLFPAPGLPKGNRVLGYDENGRCPMLINGGCSIYAHRPLACRNYDCRIFAAAGIAAGDDDKALINRRAGRWKFSYPARCDRDQHAAVRSAAAFIKAHAECFPAGIVPDNPSQLAILAIKVYGVFIRPGNGSDIPIRGSSDIETAEAVVERCGKFEARRNTLKTGLS